MKFRHFLIIFLSLFIAFSVIDAPDAQARRRSRARTTQTTSKKKKKSKKKKNSGSRQSKPVAPPEPVSYDSLTLLIHGGVLREIPDNLNPGGLRVNNVTVDRGSGTVKVGLSENFTYLPITNELITSLTGTVEQLLPDSLSGLKPQLNVGGRPLAYYISRIDPLPEKYRKNPPFVRPQHPYVNPVKGMEGDIIALWHSHGRYFKNGGWCWQRPLLFETCEDIYTMGYILPYLTPMLENAGAYVMLPRERDVNRHEVIVDNDVNPGGNLYSQTDYRESNGHHKWETGELDGFIYDLPDFRDTENPFEGGTYRQVKAQKGESAASLGMWVPDFPEDGEYAVYVSYKTLPNSVPDARYTVRYSGGTREFFVNQQMGGGTWIYLGTFPFHAGSNDKEGYVAISNVTGHNGDLVVTADAVKFGGGMGNIARSTRRSDVYYNPSTPLENQVLQPAEDTGDEEGDEEEDGEGDDSEDDEEGISVETPAAEQPRGSAPVFRTSGLPRFLEGARYWMHWAGIPESVYSPFHGTSDDYKDDYASRGHWVNYLAGGSRVLPNKKGLGIPVDLSMALHSDAGKRSDDSIVGTLGIYYTNGGASYADGTPRMNSRMLTDVIMRQITSDVRQTWEPSWTRRPMWDKSYAEARTAEVPTTLIELLSHQNFGDMQYGLDPNFRFTVGRAIYKGMARFMAERKKREVVIQPLPVQDFAILPQGKGTFRLVWAPTPDPLEPTAMPTKYIIMERLEGELGFHKVGETSSTHFDVKSKGKDSALIQSYQIIAANDGGLSFPSEVLAFCCIGNQTPVLVVNGFDRISGPGKFTEGNNAGFKSEDDFGVPYIREISFSGHQTEFRRAAGDNFGLSGSNYIGQVIAGNTFDFAAIHGEAIADNNLGFVSCSLGAVEKGIVKLSDFKLVDLILGKQKATVTGRGKSGVRYRTFSPELQQKLKAYLDKGGDLLVSGQYTVSDLTGQYGTDDDRRFASEVLGIEQVSTDGKSRSGRFSAIPTDMQPSPAQRTYAYSNTLNDKFYIVEQPDAIAPANGMEGQVFLELTDNQAPVGVLLRKGKSNRVIMTVPLETVKDSDQRYELMGDLLKYLTQ